MEVLQVKANQVGKPNGNGSVRATIPREYAEALGISNGTVLNVSMKNNKIIYEVA